MSTVTNVADILREARSLIVEHGLSNANNAQGYGMKGKGVCTRGAVYAALYGWDAEGLVALHGWDDEGLVRTLANTERAKAAFDALADVVGVDDHYALENWNDMPDRTAAEVLAVYDRAIEAAT